MDSPSQDNARSSTPTLQRRTRRSLDSSGLSRSSPWLNVQDKASPSDFFRHTKRRRVENRERGVNGQFLAKVPLQNGTAVSKGTGGSPSKGRHVPSPESASAARRPVDGTDVSVADAQQNGASFKSPAKPNPTAVALWVALKIWSAKQERLPDAESASSFLSKARSVSRMSSQARGPPRSDPEIHTPEPPSTLLSDVLEKDGDSCPQTAEFDRLMKTHADRIAPKLSNMELSTPGWADRYLDAQVKRDDMDQRVLEAAKLILNVLAILSTSKTSPKTRAVVDALTNVLEEETASSPRFARAFATLSEDAFIMYNVAIIVINIDDELPPFFAKGCVQRSIESKEVSSALINSPKSLETDVPYVGHLDSRLARYLLLEFSPVPLLPKAKPTNSHETPVSMPQKSSQQSVPMESASEHPKLLDTYQTTPSTSPDQVRASGRVRKPTWRAVEAEFSKKKPRAKRGSKLAQMTPDRESPDKAESARDNGSFTSICQDASVDKAKTMDDFAPAQGTKRMSFDSVAMRHEDEPSTIGERNSKEEVVTQASISGSMISYKVASPEQAAVLQLVALVHEAVQPDFTAAIDVDVEALRQDFYSKETRHIRGHEADTASSLAPTSKKPAMRRRRTRSQYVANDDPDTNTSEEEAVNGRQHDSDHKSFLSKPHFPRPFTDSDGFVHTGQVNDHNEELVRVPPSYIWHRPEANGHNSSRIMQQPALGLKSRAQREKDEIYRFPPEIGERNLPEMVDGQTKQRRLEFESDVGRKGISGRKTKVTTAPIVRKDARRAIRDSDEAGLTPTKRAYSRASLQPGTAITKIVKGHKGRVSTSSVRDPAASSRRPGRPAKHAAVHRQTVG